MYIYNITTNVDESIAKEWLVWMQHIFIPKILESKKIHKAILTQVQVEEEMGGVTFSTQYFCESETILNNFIDNDLPLIKKNNSNFTGQFVEFSTKLKMIKEFIDG